MVVVLVAAAVALLILSAWEWVRIVSSACQFFLDRLDKSRDTVRPASRPQGASPGASAARSDSRPSSRQNLYSSPYLPAVGLLGAIDPAPNFSAFTTGLEIMVFSVLLTISGLLVLNWIIKTMKGSD
jgi:hypothetical protein